MDVIERPAQSILTKQTGGFLTSAPHPFTHTLSPYTGCGFGKTSCGTYCYAQFLPNWTNLPNRPAWGEAARVKSNAADVLHQTLSNLSAEKRASLRIFMSSITDPYQPIEAKYQLTRACLDIFQHFADLDLLVVQTRSPLVERDLDLLAAIPYAYLSMTIETDNQALLTRLGGGSALTKRFDVLHAAKRLGIRTQVTVSPCLPYSPDFATILLSLGADRLVIDDFLEGDGSGGNRTSQSKFAGQAGYDWRNSGRAHDLYETLKARHHDVTWSASGFCGIAPRTPQIATLL